MFAGMFEAAEFFADGRRAKKVVTNAGAYDGTEVYFYDGQKIIETRDGSGNVKSAFGGFIHGTQYIDELIMMRAIDKGDVYVYQAECDQDGSVKDWNVIALTDMGGRLVERYVYTPYGEVTVHQETSFGDRVGDEDVDSTDKGTVGTTCNTTPVTGSCRILDRDFDGDYDSTDATKFDSLTQGIARHPGKFASGVDQPFMHQGLQYEGELAQYQNRARQYDPGKRRFGQFDPMMYVNGSNFYAAYAGNPLAYSDPDGMFIRALLRVIKLIIADVVHRIRLALPGAIGEFTQGLVDGVITNTDPILSGWENLQAYGNYCGIGVHCYHPTVSGEPSWAGGEPGNHGDCANRQPINGLDRCCRNHDACYQGAPVGTPGPFTWPPNTLPYPSFGCDQEICRCMNNLSLAPGSQASRQRDQMRAVFLCPDI